MCRIVELNTLNGVKNACMSFPIQNAWKEGKPLAVHGVVYNPTDGTLKVQRLSAIVPGVISSYPSLSAFLAACTTQNHPSLGLLHTSGMAAPIFILANLLECFS